MIREGEEYLLVLDGRVINSPIKLERYKNFYVIDPLSMKGFNRDLQRDARSLIFNKYGISLNSWNEGDENYNTHVRPI